MDQEKLRIFAQVKLASRKAGFDLDLARMMVDDTYAAEALDRFIASGNAELVPLATAGKARMQALAGLANTNVAAPSPAPPLTLEVPTPATDAAPASTAEKPPEPPTDPKPQKYVKGVRG